MFQNYIVVALRNLIKHKLFSIINTVGLAIGLATCIVIMLFVRSEIGYDSHWKNADSLYRVVTTYKNPGRAPIIFAATPAPAKEALPRYFSDSIDYTSRLHRVNPLVQKDGISTPEVFVRVDKDFQAMFNLEVLSGNLDQVMLNTGEIALSKTISDKYFPAGDAVGQTMSLNRDDTVVDYKIGAVYADLPKKSALNFPAIYLIVDNQPPSNWYFVNSVIFFKLKDNARIGDVDARLIEFINTQAIIPDGHRGGSDAQTWDYLQFRLQSIKDIQLGSGEVQGGEFRPTGDRSRVIIFASIAVLILFIACTNFMNLAVATSIQRAREVAMRKVMGAERRQLMFQFLSESTLVAFVAMLIALGIVEATLPYFAEMLGKPLVLPYGTPSMWGAAVGLVFFVGLLGGSYPALVISGFRPAHVLGSFRSGEMGGGSRLRSVLVTFQFSVSIALVVATGVVNGQMLHSTTLDPGFTNENVLIVGGFGRPLVNQNREVFRTEISKIPGVESLAFSNNTPFDGNERNTGIRVPSNVEVGQVSIGQQTVGYDFFKTYEISMVAGRSFSRDHVSDRIPDVSELQEGETITSATILNQSAVKRLGFVSAEAAIGKIINRGMGRGITANLIVIGVAPDTYFRGLKLEVRPEFYMLIPDGQPGLSVRFTGNPAALNTAVEKLWTELAPNIPYNSTFVDDVVAAQFDLERTTANLLGVFSILAVLIACLGLYGLAAFTAKRRTREIGVRKVMGAQVFDIVKLLVWQFSKPVLIANMIAWPLVVWGMMQWLETFPNRIDAWLMAPLCLAVGLLVLFIAWVTVGGNAAKVARANPIKALRYE